MPLVSPEEKPNPLQDANFCSRLFSCYQRLSTGDHMGLLESAVAVVAALCLEGLVLFRATLTLSASQGGGLFKIGYKRKLKQDDMYSVLLEDRSQRLEEELQGYWDREFLRAKKDAREPSLMRAIIKCYWKFYFVLGLLTFLEEAEQWLLVAEILWAESNH
ncbi:ATP-binding cassette subfamily C member 4-like [Cervus elaphus]|uniref:ATP-binding cassette subfamily C member 4-like n=1 Tax=Cervus elaphus TaxID=9860 RepID=UPI001CC2CCA0|nr:ATP-binding cassette subfamily C member 4-like [Cervus elaphus]